MNIDRIDREKTYKDVSKRCHEELSWFPWLQIRSTSLIPMA